jgi:hypothetical protein
VVSVIIYKLQYDSLQRSYIDIQNIAIMSSYKYIQLQLCKVCESEDISVDTLREKIKELSTTTSSESEDNNDRSPLDILRDEIKNINPGDNDTINMLNKYNFFHKACLNPNVTSEVIEYISDEFPGIETVTYLCTDILE